MILLDLGVVAFVYVYRHFSARQLAALRERREKALQSKGYPRSSFAIRPSKSKAKDEQGWSALQYVPASAAFSDGQNGIFAEAILGTFIFRVFSLRFAFVFHASYCTSDRDTPWTTLQDAGVPRLCTKLVCHSTKQEQARCGLLFVRATAVFSGGANIILRILWVHLLSY